MARLYFGAQLGAGAVRVERQQEYALAVIIRRDIGAIDARIGEHETEHVRYDQHARPVAQDLTGFGEDQLNQARVLVRLFAEIYRLGGGCDRIETGIAAFALGDDFLCDHEHVAVAQLFRRLLQAGAD